MYKEVENLVGQIYLSQDKKRKVPEAKSGDPGGGKQNPESYLFLSIGTAFKTPGYYHTVFNT